MLRPSLAAGQDVDDNFRDTSAECSVGVIGSCSLRVGHYAHRYAGRISEQAPAGSSRNIFLLGACEVNCGFGRKS